jgi:glycosyltransferase involved in cell wall biosynthesis
MPRTSSILGPDKNYDLAPDFCHIPRQRVLIKYRRYSWPRRAQPIRPKQNMTIGSSTLFGASEHYRVTLGRLPVHPKVSVLVTNYNYEEFLPRSIESVLTQSWRPFEIIVSDDGSEDRSCEVIQSYIDRGDSVVLVRGKHRGMAGCLNAAFTASSGEIICLLDADDYFSPGKLESAVAAFQSNPESGFCIHRTQRIDQSGRMGGAFPLLQNLPSGDCARSTVLNCGILMGLPPTSALSLRRAVAGQIFPIPEYYVGYAEQMIHRIAPLITPICCIEKAYSSWTLHRRNDANSSHIKVQRLEREIEFMEKLWQEQHRFLLAHNPTLAAELQPLQQNALYVKMRYILGRLTADKYAVASHRTLCSLPEIRRSYIGMFWRYSNRLPRPIFRKMIDLLETQGSLKHLLGRFLGREFSVN